MKTLPLILLSLVFAPLAPAAWTLEDPESAEVGTAVGASYGNANADAFKSSDDVFTFDFDRDDAYTQDKTGQDNAKCNPGRLVITDYYKDKDGFRCDITAGGAGNFTVRSGGPGYNTSGETAIITNQSKIDLNIRRRENSEDRAIQAVGFTLSHFGAPAGKVEFFSDDFTTVIHSIDLQPAPDSSIYVGYDAGSPTISSIRITTADASGNPISEQYGLDDLSIANTNISGEIEPN